LHNGTNPRERQDTKLEERKVYITETTVTLTEIWKLCCCDSCSHTN